MRNRLVPVLVALAALLLVSAGAASAQYLRIYYPDIEQGSSTLVVSPTGQGLLIDAGTGLSATDDDIVHFLDDLVETGVLTSLDFVVATHYDEDHIGRLEDVLNYGPVSPTLVTYDRGEFGGVPSTFAYSDYSFAASSKNRTTITPGTVLDLGGGVTATCVVVNGETSGGDVVDLTGVSQFENNVSVGLVIEYGDFDAWIGGDLTGNPDTGVADVESPTAPESGDVDLYTTNHHGSRTSSNATFLSTLKAEVAINQSSASNNFGHPNTEVVNRFLSTPDTFGNTPLFFQLNPGNPTDDRSDDSLAAGIADPDDADEALGLPGSMAVLSDGFSYIVYGGAVQPLILPADEGLGTLGDYPPAILTDRRTPRVPLASQGVTLTVDVVDEGTPAVDVLWELDGNAQPPVAMSLVSGDTYQTTLPAQLDGTLVTYRIRATDGAGQVSLSPEQGYYSGITPVTTLRVHDANGLLLSDGLEVRVEGHMTAEPGLFHPFVTQAYVQDATGSGVQVFDRQILPLARGDRAQFVGEIEQFSGQAEINISEAFGNYGFSFLASGSAPAPQVVTAAQVDESLEGRLIRINNLQVVSGLIPESGNGNLIVSDDGGVTQLTLRVDGDTDIPGSATPTGTFDLIGIASQFDPGWPFTFGYQILPRERADFLTDEVNPPPMIFHEIHADPDANEGDANGDGVVGTTDDEFLELANLGADPVDVSGWWIEDAVGVRHTFPAGTVVPSNEVTVVFGGGTPTGGFGNAAANGLVFTASSGTLALNNSGDTLSLFDASGALVQTVSYGSEGGDNQSLTRDPDLSNTPFVKHTLASTAGGARFSPGTRASGQFFVVPAGAVLLSEVLYDADGADNGLEWVELVNVSDVAVDLSLMSLGAGGSDYTSSLLQLDGTVQPGATFVVGGPDSTAANSNPVYDQAADFSPDLQNSGATADGVALFNVRASKVTATTVPVDAVVYGGSNDNGLIDETGSANAPEVGDAGTAESIERLDTGAWQIQTAPTPNASPVTGTGDGGGGGDTGGTGSHPVLSEVFYDADGSDDGLEWVEIHNPTSGSIDLAGYSLGAGGTDYTYSTVQLSGTLAAGATIVVGGPTSSSLNGSPTLDLAVDFSPDFQNSGSTADGVALFHAAAVDITATTVPVDAVVYGGSNGSGLIDETGVANPPEVGDAPGGSSIERVDLAGAWQIQGTPTPNTTPLGSGGGGGSGGGTSSGDPILTEVFYDADGSDDGLEWVEIHNPTSGSIDLSGYSLGAGGTDYTYSTVQLSGTLAAGATLVVGGPTSSSLNGSPVFDLAVDFSPDFQNSGSTADGVALFGVPATDIAVGTVPVDAVIYGGSNGSGLIDETGVANPPEVGDAPAGSSIERVDEAGAWQEQGTPTPGSVPF